MEMAPGERCEIIMDLEKDTSAQLLTIFEDDLEAEGIIDNVLDTFNLSKPDLPEPSLTLIVDSNLPVNTTSIPEKLK